MSDARIHLDGNIGGPRPGTEQAIDIQASQSGMMYAKFSVATTERKKTQDGSWEDGDTSWWNCTAFGNTAEMAAETLYKGDPVMLDGKVKIRKYEKDGETKQSVEVTVDKIGLDLSRVKRRSSESRQSRSSYDDSSTPPF